MASETYSKEFASQLTPRSRVMEAVFDRAKLDSWCEKGIFCLIIGILVYSPIAIGSVRTQEFVLVQWLTVAVLALWTCRFWLNRKHRLLWPPVCWAVVGFMAYAVGRYCAADIEYVARQEMIKVLIYGFLFLAIVHNLYHLERIQAVGMILLCLGMVLGMYALGQFLTESDYVLGYLRPAAYHKRGSATFFCPNHLAGYLEILLPLGLAYTLTSRLSHLSKILLAYATLAIFTGIVVSISLGGWIATGLTLVVFFVWLMRWRDYRMQGVLVVGGLIAVATTFIMMAELSPNRLNHLGAAFQADDARRQLWKPAIQMWQDHFWFGAGPAHFEQRFPQYRPVEKFLPAMQTDPVRAHNDYLNTLADWGLIGAMLVLAAWVLFYWDVLRGWKFVQRAQNDLATKRSNKASFVMGGALGLLAILVHSFGDFNMHVPANAILVVAIMALVGAHFRYTTERYWHTVSWPVRIIVTLVLLAGAGYLGVQSWRQSIESYWLAQSKTFPLASPQSAAALERALAAEAKNPNTFYQLGESYRLRSWEGGTDYQALAETALGYFRQASVLNPYDPLSLIRAGMCFHWLRRHAEAAPCFEKALKLDPYGYVTLSYMGWHYVQLQDWPASKPWFEKSLQALYPGNLMAQTYIDIVIRRISEMPKPK